MIEFESSSPERDPSEPHPIEAESYRILRSRVDLSYLPPLTRAVTERVIHASADFDYVTDLVTDEAALASGVAAIRRGAPVVADVAMVASGITSYPAICKIGEGLATRLARTVGITVSAAAARLAFGEAGPGAVWVIGCAPTALGEILQREVSPALIIGLPVGLRRGDRGQGGPAGQRPARAQQPVREGWLGRGGGRVQRAAAGGPRPGPRGPRRTARGRPPMNPALLIAGHGTRDAAGVAAFAALTERVARLNAGRMPVAGGFIELSEPPLKDAVTDLAARGHRDLVAVPLMLSAAGHSKGDVPAALARETARHPGLSVRYGRPLGPHPVLLDLMAARIDAVTAGLRSGPAVLLAGRGTSDPDGNADVVKVARLLWEGRGYEFAETAFISLARPSVPEGLERCRRLGARQHRGGPVLPVPRRPAGPGDRAGGRVRRGPSRPGRPRHRCARGLRRDRRAGGRALPRGAGGRHPDELRPVRVPDRATRLRPPRRPAAAAARPSA